MLCHACPVIHYRHTVVLPLPYCHAMAYLPNTPHCSHIQELRRSIPSTVRQVVTQHQAVAPLPTPMPGVVLPPQPQVQVMLPLLPLAQLLSTALLKLGPLGPLITLAHGIRDPLTIPKCSLICQCLMTLGRLIL